MTMTLLEHTSRPRVALIILLLSSLLHRISAVSYVVNVPRGDEVCVFIRTPRDRDCRITGNFDMIDDNLSADPLVVMVLDENVEPVWIMDGGIPEGNFDVTTKGTPSLSSPRKNKFVEGKEEGLEYQLCIQNGMLWHNHGSPSDGMDREVGFSIRVNIPPKKVVEDELNLKKADKLQEMIGGVQERLHDMLDHQRYLTQREIIHRETTQKTFSSLVLWNSLEALALIVVAVLQILYMRRFFEHRQKL